MATNKDEYKRQVSLGYQDIRLLLNLLDKEDDRIMASDIEDNYTQARRVWKLIGYLTSHKEAIEGR